MAGSEIMEVMMTGGDGGEMNEDTLAQVVSMLQNNGQLTGPNQTIIIRQPGSDEIQMVCVSLYLKFFPRSVCFDFRFNHQAMVKNLLLAN